MGKLAILYLYVVSLGPVSSCHRFFFEFTGRPPIYGPRGTTMPPDIAKITAHVKVFVVLRSPRPTALLDLYGIIPAPHAPGQ